eukprot:m.23924 g.23924  ORF g.23924 m.23924 type:complete len:132 (+) comp5596_c0_seq1:297-692(+)
MGRWRTLKVNHWFHTGVFEDFVEVVRVSVVDVSCAVILTNASLGSFLFLSRSLTFPFATSNSNLPPWTKSLCVDKTTTTNNQVINTTRDNGSTPPSRNDRHCDENDVIQEWGCFISVFLSSWYFQQNSYFK